MISPIEPSLSWTSVAVVGAGTGNDVAASLRAGAGRVDAIEIDPAILATGKLAHPEKPYKASASAPSPMTRAPSCAARTENTT